MSATDQQQIVEAAVTGMPNFFVVGAAKAATTTLHAILDQHTEIYCPPLKEPGFFADDDAPRMFDPFSGRLPFDGVSYVRGPMTHHEQVAYIKDAEVYRQLYRRVTREKAVGDFSTAYLCSVHAARKIKAFNPLAKIIMVLREPADRALSHYKMDQAIGLVSAPFNELIAAELASLSDPGKAAHFYIRLGFYAAQVERYLSEFPEAQIKIILFEDVRDRREETIEGIESFLGVSHQVAHLDMTVNKSEEPRNRHLVRLIERTNIRPIIRRLAPRPLIEFGKKVLYKPYSSAPLAGKDELARLHEVFVSDVRRLSTLIQRDLGHWQAPA